MEKTRQMSSPETEKIVRRKLSDQVFDRLREMIVSGELHAGGAMPSERDLMERFGVGRPAVREALQSMHTMGLITITHGERSRVNELSAGVVLQQVDSIAQLLLSAEPENLEYLKQARRMFESGMVHLAAERATRQDIAELRALVLRQRGDLDDPVAFVHSDTMFHTKIAGMSGNPIIAAVSAAMLKWLFHYHKALLHWSGREEVTLAEHDRIVDLIEARDAEGAVTVMRAHLDRSNALYAHRG